LCILRIQAQFYRLVNIAEKLSSVLTSTCNSTSSISSSSSPLSILSPIRGGAIIGGIYDIGLKGAFMGYRGLLLNDPYKRDRIDGCMLDIFRFVFLVF
jgi:hypothetical protein